MLHLSSDRRRMSRKRNVDFGSNMERRIASATKKFAAVCSVIQNKLIRWLPISLESP
jgi:hypothetical protein